MWVGLHHVTGEHAWALGGEQREGVDPEGFCGTPETERNDSCPQVSAFQVCQPAICSTYFLLLWKYFTVILNWCFYELYFPNVNIVYCFHCAIRSTADLESYHNHILMYASKRFSFSPPVYAARILLAGLDYNHHIHRPAKRKDDGSIIIVYYVAL